MAYNAFHFLIPSMHPRLVKALNVTSASSVSGSANTPANTASSHYSGESWQLVSNNLSGDNRSGQQTWRAPEQSPALQEMIRRNAENSGIATQKNSLRRAQAAGVVHAVPRRTNTSAEGFRPGHVARVTGANGKSASASSISCCRGVRLC